MPVLALFAAAGLTLGALDRLIRPDDYPIDALRSGQSAAVLAELVIDPKGRVMSCEVQQSVGDPKLAQHICRIAQKRRIAAPATRDGRHIHARYRGVIRMFAPDTPGAEQVAQAESEAENTLNIAGIAKELTGRNVDLAVEVDQNGNVVDCVPMSATANADLAEIACKYKGSFVVDRMTLPDGTKGPFLSNLRVQLQPAQKR